MAQYVLLLARRLQAHPASVAGIQTALLYIRLYNLTRATIAAIAVVCMHVHSLLPEVVYRGFPAVRVNARALTRLQLDPLIGNSATRRPPAKFV